MTIEKCDLCRKKLSERNDVLRIGRGFFEHFVLCDRCGKPIARFMAQHRLGAIQKGKKK